MAAPLPFAARVRSLAERPALLLFAYGCLVAGLVFSFTHAALLVNDGHIYMEMARSAPRGTLEIPNGLEVVDSPELWITHSVKRGLHLYAKYPPLYGVIAALPFALLGIRGLYLVNAIALAAAIPAFYLLARRVLPGSRPLLAALLLPVGTPLAAFGLTEIPHLLAMSLVLWSIVAWEESRTADTDARAAAMGLAAGLLAGCAFGVRMPNVLFAIPLVAGSVYAKRRGSALLATSAGFLLCVGAVALVDLARFGSANPFSYGPPVAFGAPAEEETPAYFLRPAVMALAVIGLAAIALSRRAKSLTGALAVLGGAGALVAAITPLRAVAATTAGTTGSMLLNASIAGAGWSTPYLTGDWMNKALLVCAPFLVLGLAATTRALVRDRGPLESVMAWMVLLVIAFLSQRDPDPRSGIGVTSFFSISPRYLVDAMPLLYLLAWSVVPDVRVAREHLTLGAAAGAALALALWMGGAGDLAPWKVAVLTNAPVALAGLVAAARAAMDRRMARDALVPLIVLAHAFTLACVVSEDGRALAGFGAVEERWGRRFLEITPANVAVVGWGYAKDAIFHVRAHRDVVSVDASVDEAARLADTLDALGAAGRTAFYFGWGIERCAPRLEGRYRSVLVSSDPVVYRLDPLAPATAGL
jgi:hypothetical protein